MHKLWPYFINKTLRDIKISTIGVCNTFKCVSSTNEFLRKHWECNGRLRIKRWYGNHVYTGNINRTFFTIIYINSERERERESVKHELRIIELVRIIFSQLVSVVAFFMEVVWNSEFDKNCMTSNMFCFTMMSLVISRLSCFRLAEIRRKGSSMKVLFYLLSSRLSPNGTSVFSFWIQKFSLITNISRSVSLEPCKFTSLSMMMNLACLLKLCPFSWKCFQARMELGFLVSFLWLFNLRLNAISAFPTYSILHNMHSIR